MGALGAALLGAALLGAALPRWPPDPTTRGVACFKGWGTGVFVPVFLTSFNGSVLTRDIKNCAARNF